MVNDYGIGLTRAATCRRNDPHNSRDDAATAMTGKMSANGAGAAGRGSQLVRTTTATLRQIVIANPAGAHLGSLTGLARQLGVGIVTIQQAARILEHEGLLLVRRGPGGGYFGARPDAATLERSMEAYLGGRHSSYLEALETLTLLDCELMPAAARCLTDKGRENLRGLADQVDGCNTSEMSADFEDRFHDVLFAIVERPLMEILARVVMRLTRSEHGPALFPGEAGRAAWKEWRHQIIGAILKEDESLARFEAVRHRADLLHRLATAQAVQEG
jgi:GntR family transcriptional regulator, transcriptional repressor for pyruvate dehydrogenase complex